MAFDDYEIRTRPMTSDEVLVALVVFARPGDGSEPLLGECTPLADATRDDPAGCVAAEFGNGLWADAGNRLNELFGVSLDREAWRGAFKPKRSRTVGNVCDLIARHAKVPMIEPVVVLGDRSLAAGAFLVLRRIFADAGVDVSTLRPSSPLRPYLRRNFGAVLPQLLRVAPRDLPHVTVDAPVHVALGWGMTTGFGMLAMSRFVPPLVTIGAAAFGVAFLLASWICARVVKPLDVHLGNARTFADLARVLAGERCALPDFPVVTR
jgi:hypothetical protein